MTSGMTSSITTTAPDAASGRTRIHTVQGGNGLNLHVREWGPAEGPPILFLHGLSQCHLGWVRQYESDLAEEFRLVACDLRGHGMSDAPPGPEHYTTGKLWADDVAAIIDQLGLDRPVLVGWSYGAFMICDYVRTHGQDRISAIDFVGGAAALGEHAFGTYLGPGFLDHFAALTSDDLPTSITGMRGLIGAFAARALPGDVVETLLCGAMVVRPEVRAHLGAREIDDDDVLRNLRVPLLISHGRADTIVLPAMADHMLDTCPTAEASWYDGVGHVPHLERPDRFNRELADLARRVRG